MNAKTIFFVGLILAGTGVDNRDRHARTSRPLPDGQNVEAGARGYRRVSLETGTTAAFAPARALYASAGFIPCGPFGDYEANATSAFMTLDLTASA